VFSGNFVVNLKTQTVSQALMTFPLPIGGSVIPHYSVDGLRRIGPRDIVVTFAHNGLLKIRVPLPSTLAEGLGVRFYPTAIDLYVRSFVVGAALVMEAAGLSVPALLGVSLWTNHPYVVTYDEDPGTLFPPENHKFPILTLTALGRSADNQVRQLCDLVHQTFGRSGSPLFTMDGTWQGRRFGAEE